MRDSVHRYSERLRNDPELCRKLLREIARQVLPGKDVDHISLEYILADFFGFDDTDRLHGKGVIDILSSPGKNILSGMFLRGSKLGRKGPVVYYFPTDKLKSIYREYVDAESRRKSGRVR